MTALRTSWLLRLALAVAVLLAVPVSASWSASQAGAVPGSLLDAASSPIADGWSAPICHAGTKARNEGRHAPVDHACCAACALRAPAVLPEAPSPAGCPAPVTLVRAVPPAAGPVVARPFGAHRARGPPAA